MNKYILVLTTVDNKTKAEEIAKFLVEKRIAACVNIIEGNSFYRWKGKIEETKEFLLFIKGKNFQDIEKMINQIHPYEVPEVIKIEISDGNSEYLKWIDEAVED